MAGFSWSSHCAVPQHQSEHGRIANQLRQVAQASNYSVVAVSWEDCTRGFVGDQLSCWGANITDVRIKDRQRRPIYTLRSQNWNERLAIMSTDDVALVVGNQSKQPRRELTSVTLTDYLRHIGTLGAYAGVPSETDMRQPDVDQKVSVRFQTVFVPSGSEFAVNTYSYGTYRDEDPQNMLLLCTAQGTSVNQDHARAQNVYHHNQRPEQVNQNWLRADESSFGVGGEQKETKETAEKAAAAGQAFARTIGVKGMGTRFNTVMLVQIPLKQTPRAQSDGILMCNAFNAAAGFSFGAPGGGAGGFCAPETGVYRSMSLGPDSFGASSAARVSMGANTEEVYTPLEMKTFVRHESQHITVTMTMYYAVTGGVPTTQDVQKAIDDLNHLYRQCQVTTRLEDAEPHGITDPAPLSGPPAKVQFSVPRNLSPSFPTSSV